MAGTSDASAVAFVMQKPVWKATVGFEADGLADEPPVQ